MTDDRSLVTVFKPTVFVIDDDASMRRALSYLLQSAGYKVETYSSAEEFLAAGALRRCWVHHSRRANARPEWDGPAGEAHQIRLQDAHYLSHRPRRAFHGRPGHEKGGYSISSPNPVMTSSSWRLFTVPLKKTRRQEEIIRKNRKSADESNCSLRAKMRFFVMSSPVC